MIAGRYTLLREIGRGGMGAVHLARDEVLDREVAMKVVGLVPGVEGPNMARVEREARLAAQLNHPHVVAVFDLCEHEGQHWLVMEYVAGETLADRIQRTGPLGQREAAQVLWQAADALAAAHARGIVHRDVKPSNILISAEGDAKLTDFGIARAQADATLTQTGLVTGSPAYIAPEVASGQLAAAAADVWSLGASLFHALAGHPPYDVSENLIGGLYQIVHEEPPRLAGAGRLGRVLEATMVRDPDARWPMIAVRDALAEVADDPTSPTHPVSAGDGTGEGSSTEVMVPVPPPAPTPGATVTAPPPAPPPAPAPGPAPTPAPAPARRTSVLPALLVVAALVLASVLGWGWWQGRSSEDPTGTPAAQASDSPSETASSPPPTSDAPTPEQTRQALREFVLTYLSTVTTDPEAAFRMLTPDFQAESGGYEGYISWWGTVESASPSDIVVDPEALTVEYDVDYVMDDGSEQSDDVSLQLVRQDDRFLIAGEG